MKVSLSSFANWSFWPQTQRNHMPSYLPHWYSALTVGWEDFQDIQRLRGFLEHSKCVLFLPFSYFLFQFISLKTCWKQNSWRAAAYKGKVRKSPKHLIGRCKLRKIGEISITHEAKTIIGHQDGLHPKGKTWRHGHKLQKKGWGWLQQWHD